MEELQVRSRIVHFQKAMTKKLYHSATLGRSKSPKYVKQNLFFFFFSAVLNCQFYGNLNKIEMIWFNLVLHY